jgi:cobalt/nickel transport system ATP-binding protein
MHHSIEIEKLTFSYPDGNNALSEVSLVIQPGERVALVGPNGAGKSTLILHLNGILTGSGSVRVCGLEVKKETLGRIRAMVGMVFQSPDDQLFSPRVFDDVAYGPIYQGLPPTAVQERVDKSLAAVAMSDYAQRVSHHLSMGEKKRIAIATVLSMEPEVLILAVFY